jgi:hypothetical protein
LEKYLEVAREILENHYVAGVRSLSDDENYQVGDFCRESYEWDLEQDISAYFTTGETAGGTCATHIPSGHETFDTDEWEKELADRIAVIVEKNKRIYRGDKQAIIVGKQYTYDGWLDGEGEIRIVNAKVIMIIE